MVGLERKLASGHVDKLDFYKPQLLQFEAVQPVQEEPAPATGEEMPALSLEKDTKRENCRLATLPHFGQCVSLLALSNGFLTSNLCLHSGQRYS